MSEKGSHICPVWLSFMLSNSIRKWLDPPSRVLDRLGVRADDVVIDFGCGPGFYTIPLARMAGRVIARLSDWNA